MKKHLLSLAKSLLIILATTVVFLVISYAIDDYQTKQMYKELDAAEKRTVKLHFTDTHLYVEYDTGFVQTFKKGQYEYSIRRKK
jgi:hypothetical protein